jgi:hypothetical protein
LFSSSLVNLGIVAWFNLDNDYIVSELCENRFNETSNCKGHCVLEKTVNDAQPVQAVSLEFKLIDGVFNSAQEEIILPNQTHRFGILLLSAPESFIADVYQPPERVI